MKILKFSSNIIKNAKNSLNPIIENLKKKKKLILLVFNLDLNNIILNHN